MAHEILDAATERRLIAEAQGGDNAARDRIIACNHALILRWASRVNAGGNMLDDLYQVGALAMMKAVRKFDLVHGGRLSTLSVRCIWRAMTSYRSSHSGPVRLPKISASVGQQVRRMMKAGMERDEMLEKLEAPPTTRRTVRAHFLAQTSVSLDPRLTASPIEHMHTIEIEDLRRYLRRLPKRELVILRRRFGLGGGRERTRAAIAEKMGLSKSRVRQIEMAALARLRREMCPL